MTPPLSNVNKTILQSSIWMVGLRWAMRLIGIVNTFILARLLMPADFGLVAMGMLMVGLVEVLGQTGQILALIRHPDPTREHYDTVWTVSILVGIGITVILWSIAPLATYYFHDARAVVLVKVLALRALMSGFENIGVVAFRKELQFSKEFNYQVAQRIINLVVTVACAWWLRNYWALVVGILGGRFLSVAMSYLVHPYRPRLCFTKMREIWSFSFWMLLVHVAQFIQEKTDEFVIGNFSPAAALGSYNVAADLSTAPTIELVLPMTRALFPIFSRISEDEAALKRAYLDILAAVSIIVCSTTTGVYMVAHDFVVITLGWKWVGIVPLVRILAFSGGFYALGNGVITLLSATGHGRLSAGLTLSRTLVAIPILIGAAIWGEIETIAMARTILSAVFVPGVFFGLRKVLPVTTGEILSRLWRPAVAAALMAGVITLVQLAPAVYPAFPILRLFLDAATGASSYLAFLLGLWYLAGRPAGPEAAIVRHIQGWLARVRPPGAPEAVRQEGDGPLVVVISTFSSAEEWQPIYRSLYKRGRNRLRRLYNLVQWRWFGHWAFHYSSYETMSCTNRGDSAIRVASIQLLRKRFGEGLRIREYGWSNLDAAAIEEANRSASLVVLAGGGYFFVDAEGNMPERVPRHEELFRNLRKPLVGLALGVNYLLDDYRNPAVSSLAPASNALLGRFLEGFVACSARDRHSVTVLSEAENSSIELVPDPALLMQPSGRVTLPRRTGRLRIGVNLAFHGKKAGAHLRKVFPKVARALKLLQEEMPCEIIYFLHAEPERLVARLLQAEGIALTVVDCPAEEMLDWYATLDVHLCVMLHSAILASCAEIPVLNIAYDAKNFAFAELVGVVEVRSPDGLEAEEICVILRKLLRERTAIVDEVRRRKEVLSEQMDAFLAKIALAGETLDAPQKQTQE